MEALLGFLFDGVTPFHVVALAVLSTQLKGIRSAVSDLGARVTRLELLPTARAELAELKAREVTIQ